MATCFFPIYGGKSSLSSWILKHFPENYTRYDYVEGFGGAANVLLNKIPSKNEYYIEKNYEIYKIFYFFRNDYQYFMNILDGFGATKDDFEKAKKGIYENDVYGAVCAYVARRLSFGSRCQIFRNVRTTCGGRNGLVNSFENAKQKLPEIYNRLLRVNLHNADILSVLSTFGGNHLIYLDPPYLHISREQSSLDEYGKYELSNHEHIKLLDIIDSSPAKIILSGYDNTIYQNKLKNWNKVTRLMSVSISNIPNKSKRQECLWTNY